MNSYFITGIGTDVGKTIASSILVESLKADYWKPIQAGNIHSGDAFEVNKLISNSNSKILKSIFELTTPASPHISAEIDQIEINLDKIQNPKISNKLIIEGAGGILVPLNRKQTVLDLIQHLETPVILVSKNYLGGINHTLMSIEVLKSKNIPIKGIIYNEGEHPENEEIVHELTGIRKLFTIPYFSLLNKKTIYEFSRTLNLSFL